MTIDRTPLVVIVVLNWNGLTDTIDCLASIREQSYPNFHVMVVDNGSTDGSVEALRPLQGQFELFFQERNRGYTGGNNFAIAKALEAGADYIWLLNNDATVTPDTLARLVARGEEDPGLGLIGPVIRRRHDPDQIDFLSGMIDLEKYIYSSTIDPFIAAAWEAKRPDRIAFTGTAMLIRAELARKIGGLDDRFFAYWEDIDYCIRSIRAGFRNLVVPDAYILHGPRTLPAFIAPPRAYKLYLMARNEILLWRKQGPWRKIYKPIIWAIRHQLIEMREHQGDRDLEDALLSGIQDGFLGVGGAYNPTRRPWGLTRLIYRLLTYKLDEHRPREA